MASAFLYGSLCHGPLLERVFGEAVADRAVAAQLKDHAVGWDMGQSIAMLVARAGDVADGLLVQDLSAQEQAKLAFFTGAFGCKPHPVTVQTGAGAQRSVSYEPQTDGPASAVPWSLADWHRDWGAISLRMADEIMSYFGQREAEYIHRWLPLIRMRAASWVRAQAEGPPVGPRRGFDGNDVETRSIQRPYVKFFMLEEQNLRFRQFDGGFSDVVDRAALVSGDAVTVLPYDAARDRVLIIEQFRVGPWVRGDPRPWSLEPIAGRIDPGESPEDAVHREAMEEAGLSLQRLELVARYYPSPGANTEYIYSYVALADLPDSAAGIGGQASEAEDIRGILLSFGALMDLLASGQAENAPLILTAQWLAAMRARLRGGA